MRAPDVQAAAAQMKSAEFAHKAAVAEYYPSVDVMADYGAIGENPSQSHGTFSVTGAVQFPIFAPAGFAPTSTRPTRHWRSTGRNMKT